MKNIEILIYYAYLMIGSHDSKLDCVDQKFGTADHLFYLEANNLFVIYCS